MASLFVESLLFFFVFVTQAHSSANFSGLGPWEKERLEWYWNLVGGQNQFEVEIEKASKHASSLRNGQKCEFKTFNYYGPALVGKLCFDDGICWAAKFVENNDDRRNVGIKIMESIEVYCPELPIPRFYESSTCTENQTMCYYLMDWVEGRTLEYHGDYREVKRDVVQNGVGTGKIEMNVTMPEQVPTQLASFVHKLATCPIPAEERKCSL
jgi:hypothetical protein